MIAQSAIAEGFPFLVDSFFTTTSAEALGRSTGEDQYWQKFSLKMPESFPASITSAGAKFGDILHRTGHFFGSDFLAISRKRQFVHEMFVHNFCSS